MIDLTFHPHTVHILPTMIFGEVRCACCKTTGYVLTIGWLVGSVHILFGGIAH